MNEEEQEVNNENVEKGKLRPELRSEGLGIPQPLAGLDKGSRKWWYIGGGIVLLLIILAVVSVFALPGRSTTTEDDGEKDKDGIFGSLPKALNNKLQSSTVSGLSGRTCDQANRRPIGAMLSSDVITRPVSGFSDADMVWELPVLVNDVTRLMAIYQCGRPDDIGSIRSARHDYLFLAEGLDAILAHWGGSYHALNRIGVGEFDTINALTNPFNAFFRKDHLPAPYNGFTNYENLWNALVKLEYRAETTFTGYKFKDDVDEGERITGGTLSIAWPAAFRAHYEYDAETNRYVRYWGGTLQVEGGDNVSSVAPSSVVIMRAANGSAEGPGGYNDVDVEGSGPLEVYQDGKVIHGSWKKNELDKTDPVHFLNEQGKNIVFTRGQVWVMVVEPEITVEWQEEVVESETGLTPEI